MAIQLNKKILFAIVVLAFMSPAAAHAATIGRVQSNNIGLVGHWTFDGSKTNWATGKTNDSSGQGNTGQLISMSTSTTPVAGKVGQGFTFDGVNDVVNMGNVLDFERTSSFSHSFWYKTSTADPTSATYALSKVAAGTFQGYALLIRGDLAGNPVQVELRGTSTFLDVLYNQTWVANKWTHLVWTYDGSQTVSGMKLYRDGVLQTLTSSSNDLTQNITNSGNFIVGAFQATIAPFVGSLDDVRVYNRTLSAAEVGQLYNSGAANVARSNSGPNAPLSSGLVGYWTFDGSKTNWTSNTTQDSSGQGNTGRLVSLGTTTSPVAGKIGQAFSFNGTSSYVSEATSISGVRSVAFWAKAGITGASQGLINLTGTTVYISTDSSSVLSGTGFTSPSYYIDGSASTTPGLYDNRWHYVVVTGTAAITGSQVELGRANGVYFGGTLDDVRFYTKTLSASEARQLYDMGR